MPSDVLATVLAALEVLRCLPSSLSAPALAPPARTTLVLDVLLPPVVAPAVTLPAVPLLLASFPKFPTVSGTPANVGDASTRCLTTDVAARTNSELHGPDEIDLHDHCMTPSDEIFLHADCQDLRVDALSPPPPMRGGPYEIDLHDHRMTPSDEIYMHADCKDFPVEALFPPPPMRAMRCPDDIDLHGLPRPDEDDLHDFCMTPTKLHDPDEIYIHAYCKDLPLAAPSPPPPLCAVRCPEEFDMHAQLSRQFDSLKAALTPVLQEVQSDLLRLKALSDSLASSIRDVQAHVLLKSAEFDEAVSEMKSQLSLHAGVVMGVPDLVKDQVDLKTDELSARIAHLQSQLDLKTDDVHCSSSSPAEIELTTKEHDALVYDHPLSLPWVRRNRPWVFVGKSQRACTRRQCPPSKSSKPSQFSPTHPSSWPSTEVLTGMDC